LDYYTHVYPNFLKNDVFGLTLANVLHQCDENPDKGNFSTTIFKMLCHNTLLL